ncbi:hypothetical protein [Mesorhizobium sp. 1B3]|uniref:hypothetical protein n=1 Tax=Mesorhizobium sp. 1B3 TaxID=3243599 RepID=UPI003D966D53
MTDDMARNPEDPKTRLDQLEARITALKKEHERVWAWREPPKREPLTTVFDAWNAEIRQRDREIGRLSPELRVAAVLVLLAIAVLLEWCQPGLVGWRVSPIVSEHLKGR